MALQFKMHSNVIDTDRERLKTTVKFNAPENNSNHLLRFFLTTILKNRLHVYKRLQENIFKIFLMLCYVMIKPPSVHWHSLIARYILQISSMSLLSCLTV